MTSVSFFDRDLSWLSFNHRVLQEAGRASTPLLERIKFLSIYSSNLDEFYRVRVPVLQALAQIKPTKNKKQELLKTASETINLQQREFGSILNQQILPQLENEGIYFLYNREIPKELNNELSNYFLSQILAYLQPVNISEQKSKFFPNNNELYFLVNINDNGVGEDFIINIPSNQLSRFYKIKLNDKVYVVLIDDIIRQNLNHLFRNKTINNCHSFKITRNAEIDLKDEYQQDMAEQIEEEIKKRDVGLATRLLIEPGLDGESLSNLILALDAQNATLVSGGKYHNLKDLSDFPVNKAELSDVKWPKIQHSALQTNQSIFEQIDKADILVNTPYQSYDSILRFFNEAANDENVSEIYTTLYRVAKDSRIVNALISAAKNGKKVSVLVELKARFDEANNIKWTKKMKQAGVKVEHSVTALKVHAKVALVKQNINGNNKYFGLLATGNFNETTANFYTDHILMTANLDLLSELELLFDFLAKREKPSKIPSIDFKHLLVAQFNLQERFIALIDGEIAAAKAGKKAEIIIKLNNLEEKVMITKLYEAAAAGVQVKLIIRSICRIVPQANLNIHRIVDRYLEHGRIFVFHNSGDELIYLGSADWMSRNIYHRIEVCFPIINSNIKRIIKTIVNIELQDNVQAVTIDEQMRNVPIQILETPIRSQEAIYQYLKNLSNE